MVDASVFALMDALIRRTPSTSWGGLLRERGVRLFELWRRDPFDSSQVGERDQRPLSPPIGLVGQLCFAPL